MITKIKKNIKYLKDFLITMQIRRKAVFLLLLLSVCSALFEGFGVALLLPVMKYVEMGKAVFQGENISFFWRMLEWVFVNLNISINLPMLLVFCFIPIILRQLFFYAYSSLSAKVQQAGIANIRYKMFSKLVYSNIAFFDEKGQGKTNSILTLEAERISKLLSAVFLFISNSTMLCAYVTFLAMLSFKLTLFALATLIFIEFIVKRQMKIARTYGIGVSKNNDLFNNFINQKVSGLRLVKLHNTEGLEKENLQKVTKDLAGYEIKIQKKLAFVQAIIEPTLILGAFIVLYVAVALLGMSLSSLGLFLFVLFRMLPITKSANKARNQIAGLVPSFNNIKNFIKEADNHTTIIAGTRSFDGLKKEISFENVSFSYNSNKPILNNISFLIPANKTTAIVGQSGSGKSTIINLLVRLFDVSEGSILFDGVPLKEFKLNSLRYSIGYVAQDSFLMNDTIYNNIVYGLKDISKEEVIHAAKISHIHDFIESLPNGYNTKVGDRGVFLSGGEKQRFCLARALLRNPTLLILDEPTSSLDSSSERYIQETIDAVKNERTVIIIAHRLSTIQNADQILVLKDGVIKECGKHEALISNRGLYQHLFSIQQQAL